MAVRAARGGNRAATRLTWCGCGELKGTRAFSRGYRLKTRSGGHRSAAEPPPIALPRMRFRRLERVDFAIPKHRAEVANHKTCYPFQMARFSDVLLFSTHFEVSPARLEKLGVLDPALNVDTNLFIDPLLLARSAHDEMRTGATKTYDTHFGTVIKLLIASQRRGDAAWSAAERLLRFPEIKGTCLGYSAESVSGSGSGKEATANYIATASDIVRLGIDDPDLFVAMSLFEEGVGPDRISDMTTHVIFNDLLRFNARILKNLNVPIEEHEIVLRNGNSYVVNLPTNPCIPNKRTPVILVPMDILRDLPIATDWGEVGSVASRNAVYRQRANKQLGEIWRDKSLESKAKLKDWALKREDNFEVLLELLHGSKAKSYDFQADPKGELTWRRLLPSLIENVRKASELPTKLNLTGLVRVVELIIEEFRFLIEDRRFSEELYAPDGSPRPERSAQRLFYAVAFAFCKANDLDITPEAETGNGPVDFKVSNSFTGRVLVEIKLSSNNKVISGYTKQLEQYKIGEKTDKGFYILIDVGEIGEKAERLIGLKNAAAGAGQKTSELVFINGIRRRSASKL